MVVGDEDPDHAPLPSSSLCASHVRGRERTHSASGGRRASRARGTMVWGAVSRAHIETAARRAATGLTRRGPLRGGGRLLEAKLDAARGVAFETQVQLPEHL